MDWNFRSFVHQVMPLALREGTAVQTMKPMGGKFILEGNTVTPEMPAIRAEPAYISGDSWNGQDGISRANPSGRQEFQAIDA
jgi:hypothetical protein